MTTTNTAVATLTNGTAITSRSGKLVGHRYQLGTGPISAMKKNLRESGLSSREASAKVAEILAGTDGNIAWAQLQAAAELARSKGMYPTGFDLRDKSFTIRGSAAPAVKAGRVTQDDALAALGITKEQLAAWMSAK